jgi:hypothetical protein
MRYLESISMSTLRLTQELIEAAIEGYETQKSRIEGKIAELRAQLSGNSTPAAAAAEPVTRKRRKMSAAARKRIADAQRKRWATSKGGSTPAAAKAAPKAKRKLSKEGRAAIVAAAKKRWALKRVESAKG